MPPETTVEPPATQGREYRLEMNTREAAVAPSSINEEARTVRAVITTDQPVTVWDWRLRQHIDEVLVTNGGEFARQVPMYDSHWASTYSQLGSVRDIVKGSDGHSHEAVLHFARDAGEFRENNWQMVRQRHITDVSIGYSYGSKNYTDIQPNQRATIGGVEYKAGPERILRVVTKWRGREVSTVGTGADDRAKIRARQVYIRTATGESVDSSVTDVDVSASQNRSTPMPPEATAESTANDTSTTANVDGNRTAGDASGTPAGEGGSTRSESTPESSTNTPTDPIRGDGGSTIVNPVAGSDEAEIRRQERERVGFIDNYRGRVSDELMERAIDEGWDIDQARGEFNAAIVESMVDQQPISPGHRSARDAASSNEARILAVGLLMRHDIEPDADMFGSDAARHLMRSSQCDASWLLRLSQTYRNGGDEGEHGRIVDAAYRSQNLSMRDLLRRGLELEGGRVSSLDDDELMLRAMSSASVQAIFTLAFNARFTAGFTEIPDTTEMWTKPDTLPNYQVASRVQMGKFSRLKLRERGTSPADGTINATSEDLQVFEYAEKFTVDEQDIQDDTMGGIRSMTPEEMGNSAGELVPDLAYAYLLRNPNLKDGTALFHADRNNLAVRPLDYDNLKTARTDFATQTITVGQDETRHVSIRGDILICSEELAPDADELVDSKEKQDNTGNGIPKKNAHYRKHTVVSDPRLDTGVTDPLTGAFLAGEPDNWYLASKKGKYGVTVAGLKGRGTRPRIRKLKNVLDGYGMGWTVDRVAGCGATGHEGVQKNTSS